MTTSSLCGSRIQYQGSNIATLINRGNNIEYIAIGINFLILPLSKSLRVPEESYQESFSDSNAIDGREGKVVYLQKIFFFLAPRGTSEHFNDSLLIIEEMRFAQMHNCSPVQKS